ncbi:MAG: sigma 54-dependent Fis family transcriptional regulator [Myxococcales bacterium]|nr:sigma 54-dependent Fis family transcriptional regulator [Myxococcales bacterium]
MRSGPDAGARVGCEEGALTVGTAKSARLVLTDPTVSRFHCEFEADGDGVTVRDLSSSNGTYFHGAAVTELRVHQSAELQLGQSALLVELEPQRVPVTLSALETFEELIGGSVAMRKVFTVLERAAPTTTPILILGESGTGKELAARAVHARSARANGPFEVVDCGGLPPTLAESELFGHERGAFTGATGDRAGAFERADGGTLFLDELGELPLELQPKLLRVLAEGEVRRIGGRKSKKIDVRVVAATNRDLRREVNQGRFRADLYFRLAVLVARMPPLRERLDDVPLIVRAMIPKIAKQRGVEANLTLDEEFWLNLANHDWPGNVRELRNYLEQLLVLRDAALLSAFESEPRHEGSADALWADLWSMPLRSAKALLVERFEREYLKRLLETTDGNVAEAARRSGVYRGTLFRAIRRIGLRAHDSEGDLSDDEPDAS